MSHVRLAPQAHAAVPPPELFRAMRQKEEPTHAVPVHFDPAFPGQPHLVIPQPAIAPLAGERNAGRLRSAANMNANCLVSCVVCSPSPKLAVLKIAFASRSGDRVDVELAQISVAHEQSGEVVRKPKALR